MEKEDSSVFINDEGARYRLEEMISNEKVHGIVRGLADDISNRYREAGSVHLVGLLKGSFVFMADLIRAISIPVTVDFMAVTSYLGTESTGEVKILKELNEPIHGLNVVIVEDIIDTGLTLSKTLALLETRAPADLKVCTLLDKIDRRKTPIDIEFNGIVIPDEFIVGYGIDYQQRHRELDRIDRVKFL
ncbi:hypoxanthine phosphoribosyltransferase [Sediminispirochaeta smaragdinae]|uniref:Hypoxanthine phosphoribosyltransferase n=1 Tax=Sediminispirochaeta smaragdinae (strain DSM 11293 / JCM 15392 / SEBR 4228) TaxID=573413 RepID=E1RA32_SEDSS|nr:hypoxanthine phosphoribosyltransferase [Sediminispirochaeta smaragdinae]ADK83351.1 hypoxanthine phosphoribosyltransferase [Sediminispirochaeta smaragdinae DSM 11293]